MLKEVIVAGTILTGLSSVANADIIFSQFGVWSEPRIYQNDILVSNPSSIQPGQYTFRTRLEEADGIQSTTSLAFRISGPENYYLQNPGWDSITINPHGTSIRQITQTIKLLGEYTFYFELGNEQSISRQSQVIPEPSTLALLGLGSMALIGRRKRNP